MKSRRKKTPEEFVALASEIHKNKYSYQKSLYTGYRNPITITCQVHGDFEQKPEKHLLGQGCSKCGIEKVRSATSYTKSAFIEKAKAVHGDRFDYSKVEYRNSKSKVIIVCGDHGAFEQTPEAHLRGQACPSCGRKQMADGNRLSTDLFISKAREVHNGNYGYENTVYMESSSKVTITCDKHGEFEQIPRNHLMGNGCPICGLDTKSVVEMEVADYLQSIGVSFTRRDRKVIAPLELDILASEERTAIEVNGLYWHCEDLRGKSVHIDKLNRCRAKGIDLIQIFEDEWRDKQRVVKSLLAARFGKFDSKIFARKTQLHPVTVCAAKEFYDGNHIQGFTGAGEHWALSYEGIIVAMASFSKPRTVIAKVSKYDLELVRFCNRAGTQVIGGFSKLLSVMSDKKIITYCDRRLFNANGYRAVGFTHSHLSPPSYYYFKSGIRRSRFEYQKHKLKDKLAVFDPAKTETENMRNNGFRRIFDCGTEVLALIPANKNS